MSSQQPDILLHWYNSSPFAQLCSWALNYKKVDFKLVSISPVEPRPLRRPLDGGYRKTPILQIGNHVYCDSKAIFAELEKRYPEPSFYPKSAGGQSTNALSAAFSVWLTTSVFMGIVTQFPVQLLPDAFLKDRSAFSGQTMDKEKMTFAAPYLKHALRSEFAIAERLLSENKDNEWVLGTETLSLADLHLAMDIWFANNMVGHEWTSENIPSLVKHMEKTLKAVGYDSIEDRPELSAEEALEVARTQKTEFSGSHDGSLPIQLGQPVTVTPTDTGKVPSTGVLVHSTVDETVIKHDDEKAGTSVFIHFPAIAYVVFPQKSKL